MLQKRRIVAILAGLCSATALLHAQRNPAAGSTSQRGSRQIGSSAANVLGLKAGFNSDSFRNMSFLDASAKVDAYGAGFIEGAASQQVGAGIDKNLDFNLSSQEVAKVKQRLSDLRLRMQTYRIASLPADETAQRRALEFAKSLDAETVVISSSAASLEGLDKLAAAVGINVALEAADAKALKSLMSSLEGRSKRLGVCLDASTRKQAGANLAEELKLVNSRLMCLRLGEQVGRNADAMRELFLQLARLNPPPAPPAPTCGDCAGPRVPVRSVFVALAGKGDNQSDFVQSAKVFEQSARVAEGHQIVQISKRTPITQADQIPTLDRSMIQAAAPRQALVKPKKARKLLVIDLCPQGGFYHRTVAHANFALQVIGRQTGAFEPIFNNDLDNLKYPKIKEYDAVFLNSVVGPVFSDPEVIGGLTRFVREGGGVAGIHGSTYASTDVPEYGEMLGATTGPHRIEVATLKVEDPASPLTKQFGGNDVTWVDEFYHFIPTGPYTREKLHVLLSIDMAKSDMSTPGQSTRTDNDYGLAWIHSYGSGRVFNTALGHTPLLFTTPQMAQMVFAGIQFVLGDLEADTTPSARLSSRKAN